MIRRTIAAIAVLVWLWSVVVWMTGGGTLTFGGLRVSSTDPIRPLIAAAVLFGVYVLASGRQRVRDDAARAAAAAPRHDSPWCSRSRSASSRSGIRRGPRPARTPMPT